jgi:hypothetical protein
MNPALENCWPDFPIGFTASVQVVDFIRLLLGDSSTVEQRICYRLPKQIRRLADLDCKNPPLTTHLNPKDSAAIVKRGRDFALGLSPTTNEAEKMSRARFTAPELRRPAPFRRLTGGRQMNMQELRAKVQKAKAVGRVLASELEGLPPIGVSMALREMQAESSRTMEVYMMRDAVQCFFGDIPIDELIAAGLPKPALYAGKYPLWGHNELNEWADSLPRS